MRCRTLALIVLSILVSTTSPVVAQIQHQVVDEMYGAYNELDLDRMFTFYASDVIMEDPTLDLRIEGRDAMSAMWREGFAITKWIKWQIEDAFSTDTWTVVQGSFISALDGSKIGQPGLEPKAAQPFITAFQIRDGEIVRHIDFLGYDVWDRENPRARVPVSRPREPADVLRRVSAGYLAAMRIDPPDVDARAQFYADEIRFVDHTSRLDVTGLPALRRGIAQFMEAGAQERFDVTNEFRSGQFVALWGTYSRRRDPNGASAERRRAKLATILRIADGKIVQQWDFFDTNTWQRSRSGQPGQQDQDDGHRD